MALPGYKSPDLPPISVETTVSGSALSQMLARVESIFAAHSKDRPHWTVLTASEFEPEHIAQNRGAFFSSGEDAVRTFQHFAERAGVDLSAFRTCFELGCGVGRCTFPLARLFDRVIAADIAEPMLREAERGADEFGLKNIRWVLANRFAAFDELEEYDVLFTGIVLQHNPPPVMRSLLTTLLRKLRPGGIGYFQLPTYRLDYSFSADRYLASEPGLDVEMHVFPQRALFDLLWRCGCRLLEVREDGAAGEEMTHISNTLLVEKQ